MEAVKSPEEAVKGKDIILCSTSSMEPVFYPEWIEEGMHLSSIRRPEMAPGVADKCSTIVVTSKDINPVSHVSPCLNPDEIPDVKKKTELDSNFYSIDELVSGKLLGRNSDKEVTWYFNNMGLGIQFTALSYLAYKKANQHGLGENIPTDWFLENVHP